jgi:hypothetical protein
VFASIASGKVILDAATIAEKVFTVAVSVLGVILLPEEEYIVHAAVTE